MGGVFSGRTPGGGLGCRLASLSPEGWRGALVRGAAGVPGAPGRRGSAEAGTPQRAGGGRAYKGPRAAREGGSRQTAVRPCSASASFPEPRFELAAGQGCPRSGRGSRTQEEERAEALGSRQISRESWPPRAARAATRPVSHGAPTRDAPRRPLVPRLPSDPGRTPRALRAWSRTCSARCSTGCCCLSLFWPVSGAGEVSSKLGHGCVPLPSSRPRRERGRPGRGP